MKFWNWLKSFFTDVNRDKVLKVLDNVEEFVKEAIPIVALIDEKLKPLLANKPKLEAIYKFLAEYADDIDDVLAVAEKLADLPLQDMLANVALELLKGTIKTNVSLSALKLAIELAYQIYKLSKGTND
jgi:hypothetical protein